MNTTRLVELRKQHNLTQKEVADIVKCTQKMISSVEQGKKNLVPVKIKKLAKYYNVPMEELIEESEE